MSEDICDRYIKISCVTGQIYSLKVSGSHTIQNLKEIMNKNHKLRKSSILMSFNGRKLEDYETLNSIGIRNGSILNMVLKMEASNIDVQDVSPAKLKEYKEFVEKVRIELCGNGPLKERIMVVVGGGSLEGQGPYRILRVCRESDFTKSVPLDECKTVLSPQLLETIVLTLLVKLVEEFRMKMNIYKLRLKMREIAQKKKNRKFIEKPSLLFWCDTDKKKVSLADRMIRLNIHMYFKEALSYTSIMSSHNKKITEDMMKYSNLTFRNMGTVLSKEGALTFTSEEQVCRRCRQDQSFLIRFKHKRGNLVMLRLKRWERVKRQELAKRVAYLVERTSVKEAEGYLKFIANRFKNAGISWRTNRQNLQQNNRNIQVRHLVVEPQHQIYSQYLKLSSPKKLLEDNQSTNMEALLKRLKLDFSRKSFKKFNNDSPYEYNETNPLDLGSSHFKVDQSQMLSYLEELFCETLIDFDEAFLELLSSPNTPEESEQGNICNTNVDYFSKPLNERLLLEKDYLEQFGLRTPEELEQGRMCNTKVNEPSLLEEAYLEHFGFGTSEESEQDKIYNSNVDSFSKLLNEPSLLEEAYPERFVLSTTKESEQGKTYNPNVNSFSKMLNEPSLLEEAYGEYLEQGTIYHPTSNYSSKLLNEPLSDKVSLEESFFANMSYESLADVHEALLYDLRQSMSKHKVEDDEKPYHSRKPVFDDIYLRKLWLKIFKRNLLESNEDFIPNLSYEFIADIHEAFRTRISQRNLKNSYSIESYESLAEIHSNVLKELRSSFVDYDLYEALAEFHENMRLHISNHLEKQRLSSTSELDISKQNGLDQTISHETSGCSTGSNNGSQLKDSGFSESFSTDNDSEESDQDTFFYSPHYNSKYSSTTGPLNFSNGKSTVVGGTQERTTTNVKLPPVDNVRDEKTRCTICRRRLNVTNMYHCRCGKIYCAKHVHAELHKCNFNYKKYGREALRKKLPKLYVEKIKKL